MATFSALGLHAWLTGPVNVTAPRTGCVRTAIASSQPPAHKHRATRANKGVHKAYAALKMVAVSTVRRMQIVNVVSAMVRVVLIQTNVMLRTIASMDINATAAFVHCQETIATKTH